MAQFMDIELVSAGEEEPPDAYAVAFDVIYSGETWCRSLVRLSPDVAARFDREEASMISGARDALLQLLELETRPVSFDMRITAAGTVVLARAYPGDERARLNTDSAG